MPRLDDLSKQAKETVHKILGGKLSDFKKKVVYANIGLNVDRCKSLDEALTAILEKDEHTVDLFFNWLSITEQFLLMTKRDKTAPD